MASWGQLAWNSPMFGLLGFSAWVWGLGWTTPHCSSTGRIWGVPARVSGSAISRVRTQCTSSGWVSIPSPLSVEAARRTSSENSIGFVGASRTTSVPGSGGSGEGSWPAFTLSPSCSLGSGRGIQGQAAGPPGHAQVSVGFVLHLPARNLAVQGLCPKGGGKIPSAGTSLAVQWLRPCASNAGGVGSIPGWETKGSHGDKKIPSVEGPLGQGSGGIWAGGQGRWGYPVPPTPTPTLGKDLNGAGEPGPACLLSWQPWDHHLSQPNLTPHL